jgi:hypothetical protein
MVSAPSVAEALHMEDNGRFTTMKKRDKLLLSALVIGALGTVAALGVFGAFSATTQNAGNEISTGTVALSDNDAGSALFNVTGASPGESWSRCIKVTYNGSLSAGVHTYLQNTTGALAPYLSLRMTQGTQASSTFPGCSGFAPDSTGIIYSGPVESPVPGSWDAGLPINPAGKSSWDQGDSLVIKFDLTLDSATPNSLQSSSLGSTTVVWEARNA